MTRHQLAKLVEVWRAKLTPEWRVLLMDGPPDGHEGEYLALSQSKEDYTEVCLFFTDECLERTAEEIEITVVHELLHSLTRPWRGLIDDIEDDVGKAKSDLLWRYQGHEEEKLVDRLSRVLVAGQIGETVDKQ